MLKTKIIQNNLFFYLGISSFLVSSYYFNLRSRLFFDEKLALLSCVVLFLFTFVIFYILINFTYYLSKKFKIIKIEIFNVLFFTWLFVQLIKCSFDLLNIVSFPEFFGGLSFFIKIENILIKSLTTHFTPYLISILLVFILSKFLDKILRFVLILGSIFLILSFYDLSKSCFLHHNNFNANKVTVDDNKINNKKRAVVIILDSFDPQITFDENYIGIFKNFEKLKDSSFYAPNS